MAKFRKLYRNCIKWLVVGAEGCGKTSLVQRYLKDTFNDEYNKDLFMQRHHKKVKFNGDDIWMVLLDADGKREYEGHSINYYAENDIILVCYDVSNQKFLLSFKEICEEVKRCAFNKPIIAVVGCKTDKERQINIEDIQSYTEELGASYFETCAKTGAKVEEMFTSITEKHLEKNPPNKENKTDSPDDAVSQKDDNTQLPRSNTVSNTSEDNSSCSCSIG